MWPAGIYKPRMMLASSSGMFFMVIANPICLICHYIVNHAQLRSRIYFNVMWCFVLILISSIDYRWAQYNESISQKDIAKDFYEMAKDDLSLTRLACCEGK